MMSKEITGTQTTGRFVNSAVLASMAVLSMSSADAVRGDAVRSARERTHNLYSVPGNLEPTLAHSFFSISYNPGVEKVILNAYEHLISSQQRASPNIEAIVFANLWNLYD